MPPPVLNHYSTEKTMRNLVHLPLVLLTLCAVVLPAFAQSPNNAGIVVIVTDHSAYDWAWVVQHAPLLIDTRNATRAVTADRERIVRA